STIGTDSVRRDLPVLILTPPPHRRIAPRYRKNNAARPTRQPEPAPVRAPASQRSLAALFYLDARSRPFGPCPRHCPTGPAGPPSAGYPEVGGALRTPSSRHISRECIDRVPGDC